MAEQEVEKAECGGKFTWFLAGAAIGAACAILYAPKTGRETREFLSQTTQKGREAVTGTSRDIVDTGKEIYEKSRQIVDEAAGLFERGRKLVRG